MYARMAIYNFNGDDGDAKSLSARAEQGILPILQAQPGFRAYSVATGDGEVLSLRLGHGRRGRGGERGGELLGGEQHGGRSRVDQPALRRDPVQHHARSQYRRLTSTIPYGAPAVPLLP